MTQVEGVTKDFLDTLNPIKTLFARLVIPLTKATPNIGQEHGNKNPRGRGQRYRQVYVCLRDIEPRVILLGEIRETLDI